MGMRVCSSDWIRLIVVQVRAGEKCTFKRTTGRLGSRSCTCAPTPPYEVAVFYQPLRAGLLRAGTVPMITHMRLTQARNCVWSAQPYSSCWIPELTRAAKMVWSSRPSFNLLILCAATRSTTAEVASSKVNMQTSKGASCSELRNVKA